MRHKYLYNTLRKIYFPLLAVVALTACTKDRDFPDIIPPKDIAEGDVVINEFAASGATLVDEFGNTGDWIELYNTTTDTIFMSANRWYVSDDATNPYKYAFPIDTFIAPNAFFLFFADGLDTTATYIHTSFSLGATGEDIVLSALNTKNQTVTLDSYTFGPQTAGKSEGRSPNGENNWVIFDLPTPGSSNQ